MFNLVCDLRSQPSIGTTQNEVHINVETLVSSRRERKVLDVHVADRKLLVRSLSLNAWQHNDTFNYRSITI